MGQNWFSQWTFCSCACNTKSVTREDPWLIICTTVNWPDSPSPLDCKECAAAWASQVWEFQSLPIDPARPLIDPDQPSSYAADCKSGEKFWTVWRKRCRSCLACRCPAMNTVGAFELPQSPLDLCWSPFLSFARKKLMIAHFRNSRIQSLPKCPICLLRWFLSWWRGRLIFSSVCLLIIILLKTC